MKLLVVMRHNPFPPRTGSTIIAYNSIKQLSKYHSMDFICLQSTKDQVESLEFAENTEFVYQKQDTWFFRSMRMALSMLIGVPPFISEHNSKNMRVKVREVIEGGQYDAILLFELIAIQYCPPFHYNKIIVNIEDPQSIKLCRMAMLPVLSKWKKFKLLINWKMIEIYEKKVLPKIGRVLLLSEVDMRDMQEQHAYDNIGCVSYGINLPPMKEIVGFDKRTEGKIVFSGSMFHPPNIDGALFFLKHIYPLILHDYPTAKLWIVGAEPDSRIHDAAAFFGEHVIITGRVNEVSEYLQFARVSVCPIRLKIGVQTKILEALSWGTPVVTTTAGNSGIGGCSGRDLLIEDEPNKFARCVVNLLRGESWNQLSEEGRKLVEKQFSWAGSIEQLNKYIKLLILKN